MAVTVPNYPEFSKLHEYPYVLQECQSEEKCKNHKRCQTSDSSVEVRTCPSHRMKIFKLLSGQLTVSETAALDSYFYTYIKESAV